jgi:toxin CptA
VTAHAQPPLLLRPRRSRQLATFIGVTHGLALLVIVIVPLDLITFVLLATAVVSSAGLALRQHVFRSAPRSIHSVRALADGSWQLTWHSGANSSAQLSAATFSSQTLIVLNFQLGWRRAALPLFRDALDPETLRALRVRLKLSVDTAPFSTDN